MSRWQQIVSALALVFVLLVGIGVVLYGNVDVVSSNMSPTLVVGDNFTVRSGQAPAVNDIVLFDAPALLGPTNGALLSRLVAVGGQEVSFADGHLVVDGVRTDEPFLLEVGSTEPRSVIPGCAQQTAAADRCLIPDGYGFVMGDNRRRSSDSRLYGPIGLASINAVAADAPWWLFAGLLP